MMASVPGAVIRAPISLTFLAVLTVGLGPRTRAPVAVAVITSHLMISVARWMVQRHRGPADLQRFAPG